MQGMHPVHALAFWKTKASEIKQMEELYDAICGDSLERRKQLDELIAWARSEAVSDEIYNSQE